MLPSWAAAPPVVRSVVRGAVLVLAYGTVVHVVQLVGAGFAPYPGLPGPLRVYFVGLTVLDPLAAVLLPRGRRSGVVLTVAVLVTDALANGWANYGLDPAGGVTPGRIGQAVITTLALGVAAMALPMWRHAPAARRRTVTPMAPGASGAQPASSRSAWAERRKGRASSSAPSDRT